jgi:hypothetical protein
MSCSPVSFLSIYRLDTSKDSLLSFVEGFHHLNPKGVSFIQAKCCDFALRALSLLHLIYHQV